MTDLNKFTATGKLIDKAELEYTTDGTARTSFGITCSKFYKQNDEWVEDTHFFNCVINGKYGEAMQKHLTKGKQIAIEAELDHKLYNNYFLNVQKIVFLNDPKIKIRNAADINPPEEEKPDSIPF